MVTAKRKRNTLSRPERRAQRRLEQATGGWAEAQSRKTSGQAVRKPGKIAH